MSFCLFYVRNRGRLQGERIVICEMPNAETSIQCNQDQAVKSQIDRGFELSLNMIGPRLSITFRRLLDFLEECYTQF
jgi:hypothetical protein